MPDISRDEVRDGLLAEADEPREALLAQADEAWPDDPALDPEVLGRKSDNVSCYLRAYYQRIPTEDLAPPARMAAVAQAHARLGLRRPQGRALVRVREPGEDDRVGPSSMVVDIVVDDMPYLVDSVTTELNRHEAEIRLLVHPVLLVRRDVAGTLREILGVCGEDPVPCITVDGAEELTESWIHVELGPPGDRVGHDELAADLRRVLDDVRVAVEDQRRMGEVARSLANDMTGVADSDEDDGSESGALLRWLADGNFTFLGYREYDLVPAGDTVGLRQVPGTGLGILRHDRPGGDEVVALS